MNIRKTAFYLVLSAIFYYLLHAGAGAYCRNLFTSSGNRNIGGAGGAGNEYFGNLNRPLNPGLIFGPRRPDYLGRGYCLNGSGGVLFPPFLGLDLSKNKKPPFFFP